MLRLSDAGEKAMSVTGVRINVVSCYISEV